MIEREADVASRHREALHGIEAGRIFGTRAPQELAAGRYLVEQSLDPQPRAGRECCGPLARRHAMIDVDSPAVGAANPALERQARDARDGRKRLAAKAEAGYAVNRVRGKLRCRVALEREPHLARRHPRAIVRDFDQLETTRTEPDADLIRACIERIFNEFLKGACRPLDDFSSSNAIDEFRR